MNLGFLILITTQQRKDATYKGISWVNSAPTSKFTKINNKHQHSERGYILRDSKSAAQYLSRTIYQGHVLSTIVATIR